MSTDVRADVTRWYEGLAPREQKLVGGGAIAATVLVVLSVVMNLHALVRNAEKRLASKQADVAYIQSVLPELRAAPQPAGDGQSLVAIIDHTTRDAGLNPNLRGTEPNGDAGVRVRLEGAAFEAVVTWLLRVQREQGLTVQAATLEKTDVPGHVNASLTFVRS